MAATLLVTFLLFGLSLSTPVPEEAQAWMEVHPPFIPPTGGDVTVLWKVSNLTKFDLIGIFAEKNGTLLSWVKVEQLHKRIGVTMDPTGPAKGKLLVHLVSIRDNWVFKYISGEEQKVLTTSQPVVDGAGLYTPMHIHIALTASPSEMMVTFVTKESLRPPLVQLGTAPGEYTHTFQGTTHTYNDSALCEPAGPKAVWTAPGMIHDAVVAGLRPSTKYFYRVGSPHAWSEEASFWSPPAPAASTPVRFLMYGDQGLAHDFCEGCHPGIEAGGVANTWAAVSSAVQASGTDTPRVDMLLHIGDLSYARGREYIWDIWFDMLTPVASTIAYMVSVGNHEYDYMLPGEKDPSLPKTGHATNGYHPPWGDYYDDSHGECGVPTTQRFHMPDTGNAVFWYSYTYGSVHFVMLSGEHDLSEGAPQRTWLEADLARVDRAASPWVIASIHRPLYCSANFSADYTVAVHLAALLDDVLLRYSVDLVLAGHYHSYERTCPVYRNECRGDLNNPQATVHAVVGTAGIEQDQVDYLPTSWSLYRDAYTYGYADIMVHNATSLQWRFLKTDSTTPTVIDEFWLHSTHAFKQQ